jgi:hypothetical protein
MFWRSSLSPSSGSMWGMTISHIIYQSASVLPLPYQCTVTTADHVGFEVFTAVVMKSIIFWDMTPCSPLSFNGLLGVISQKMILFK